MRVLINGGAGFTGSHVVDGLVEDGHQVAVVTPRTSLDEGFAKTVAYFTRKEVDA